MVDKLPPELEFASATVKDGSGVARITEGVSKLVSLPGDTALADGQECVTLFFNGNLEKGNTLEVMLKTLVRSDRTETREISMDNTVFKSSNVKDNYFSQGNTTKASFMNADENGLEGVPVALYIYKNTANTFYSAKTATTNAEGIYEFDHLLPKGDIENLNDRFTLNLQNLNMRY